MTTSSSRCGWAMLLAGGLTALAGCNLAPHYEKPAVASPAAFKEASPATTGVSWTSAVPKDDAGRGKWWVLFQDEQLNSLEEQVQISNQTIAAAAANYRQARAQVTAARSAFLPTVTAAPSFSRVRPSQNFSTSGGGANLPAGSTSPAGSTQSTIVNEYELPVDATYEVDFWGRIRNTAKASALNAQASAGDLATAILSTQAELAQDYFQLRALDAEQKILDDTVVSYRRALDATTSLYRNGIDSEESVAQAQTQLDVVSSQATDVGVARSSTEHAIAVLIGKAPSELTLSPRPLDSRPPALPAVLPSELLERRPDVAAAERRVAAANAQIGVARSAYYPRLLLSGSAGFEATHLAEWFAWPSRFWSIGPELAGTLFDGGARRAGTEQARAAFDEAAANYRQTVLTAFQSVEDNLAALRILEKESDQLGTSVQSSQHLLELATTRYHTGIDSYLNVVTAQTSLLSNEETGLQVRLREITAAVTLIKALGGGWDTSQLPGMPGLATSPQAASSRGN